MPSASILGRETEGFEFTVSGLAGSSHEGTFQQVATSDLIGHWQAQLEDAVGFSLGALFNVSVLDVEQRIDITLGEEGFNVDIVPLGTNRLSYQIRDNKGGVVADFSDTYDPGYALQGNAQDLAYLDLFDGVKTGNRDFFIEYSGLVQSDAPGAHVFKYSTVGGFKLLVDGEVVLDVPPGGTGEALIDIPVGMHRIKIVAEHDPLEATSPTARTDDDLELTVKAPGGTTFQSLFDFVRTEPAHMIAVALVVSVNGGTAQTVDFLVEDTADIKGIAQKFLQDLGVAPSDSVSVGITASAEVTVGSAGYYSFGTATGGSAAGVAVDGTGLVYGGSTPGRVFLTAGSHEIAATATYDSLAALEAGDTQVTWRGDATGGLTLTLLGDAPSLADGFIQTLNDALEGAEGFVDGLGLLPLDLGIIEASPTLSFSLGIDAELGWQIDMPTLGATSTEQPVTFTLNVGATANDSGAFITAMVTDLVYLTPTTRTSLAEMGGFSINAGFSLPETQLGDVGFYVKSSPVAEEDVNEVFGADSPLARLNSALDGLFKFQIKLDKTLSLEEIIGAAGAIADASGAERDPDKGFDIGAFLQGLYSGKINLGDTISELAGYVSDADWEAAFNLFFRVTGLAPDPAAEPAAPAEPTEPPPPPLTVETTAGAAVEVTAEELLALVRSAAFVGVSGAEGGTPDPAAADKTVAFTDEALGAIQIKVSSIETTAETSGLADAFDALSKLFDQGFELMTGVHLDLNLPIGEILEYRGFDGLLHEDDPGLGRTELTPIVVTTTSPIVKISTNIEQAYNNAALDAIDAMLQRDDLTTLERKQLINAKIMASLQPLMLQTIEDGATAEISVSPAPFVHAAVDVFLGLIDGITSGIDSLADVVGIDLDLTTNLSDDPNLDAMFADPELMAEGIRQTLQPMGEVLKSLPDILNEAIKAVGTLFVDYSTTKANPAHEAALLAQGIEVIRNVGNWDLVVEYANINGVGLDTLFLSRVGDIFEIYGYQPGASTPTWAGTVITEADLLTQFHNYGVELPPTTVPDPQLLDWVTSIPEFFSGDLAGAVASVKDFVVTAINDVVSWADLGAIAGDWRPELTELLSSLGFNFDYNEDSDSYSLRVNDSPLAFIGDIESGITDFAGILTDLANSIKDFFVNGIDFNIDAAVDEMIEGFATTIPAMLQGISASADLDINLWDFDLGAALNLVQKTVFTPDNLKVEYTFMGETITADYGDAVQFMIPDSLPEGETPAVSAKLVFDGSYDYEYSLSPDFDFNFEMFGFSIKTMLKLGEDVLFEDVIEYALLKTTDDYDPDDELSQHDDALIEIDRQLIEAGMMTVFDTMFVAPFRDQLALMNGEMASLGDGTITLGKITDVAAGEEGESFSPITVTAGVDLEGIVQGTTGNDSLRGRSGHDTLFGLSGDDLLQGSAEADLLDGGNGKDTVSYAGSAVGVVVALAADAAGWQSASGGDAAGDRLRGFENVTGSGLADQLTGDAGVNTLSGGAGNDSLQGDAGNDSLLGNQNNDTLAGGEGDDWMHGGQHNDVLQGNAGNDTLDGGIADDTLEGGIGNDSLSGSHGHDTLYGNQDNDLMAGGEGDDWLHGGQQNDTLQGELGNDTLNGGVGDDSVMGGFGADSLLGHDGHDWLYGNQDNDVLFGGAGNDWLHGGQQNDTLTGGLGLDTLDGGLGADVFLFTSATAGRDEIAKFEKGNDKIALSAELTAYLRSAGGRAEDALVWTEATSMLSLNLAAVGLTGSVDLAQINHSGVLALSAGDFLFL